MYYFRIAIWSNNVFIYIGSHCKSLTDFADPPERQRKVRGEKLACRLTLLTADNECLLIVGSRLQLPLELINSLCAPSGTILIHAKDGRSRCNFSVLVASYIKLKTFYHMSHFYSENNVTKGDITYFSDLNPQLRIRT